jgi:predicted nucleic acid-binding protein
MTDVVLDTCCLINLCAVGDLRTWLPQKALKWYLPRAVADEAIFLKATSEDTTVQKSPVDLSLYQDAGVLIPCDVAVGSETDLFVRLAVDMDDGEAMALAIAETRGWSLASDDRKAMKVARRRGVQVLTTAEVIRDWSADTHVPHEGIVTALTRIERLARFIPAPDYPLYEWWCEILGGHPN